MMPSGRILNISFPIFFFRNIIYSQTKLLRYFLTEAFIFLLCEGKPWILLAKLSRNASAQPKEIWAFKKLFQARTIRHWEPLSGSCLGEELLMTNCPGGQLGDSERVIRISLTKCWEEGWRTRETFLLLPNRGSFLRGAQLPAQRFHTGIAQIDSAKHSLW